MADYTPDRIKKIDVRYLEVPLQKALSDAKVLQGRQKALASVLLTTIELETYKGFRGEGYTYALRAGGRSQYELAREFAPLLIDKDPNDISRLWDRLKWAGNTLGEDGLINQTITAFDTALWDLKARHAGLPLARLLGAYKSSVPTYNTTAGYLTYTIDEVISRAKELLAAGMGGIKLKVGQPDTDEDIRRVRALREALGPHVPIMIDANQQCTLASALRIGNETADCNLTWFEEPLGAHDLEGHRFLTEHLIVPIGTGEMLCSLSDVEEFIDRGAVNLIMPDAPRIGGVTPFITVMQRAREKHLMLAPHFVMEMHLPLAACFDGDVWVEHIDWLQPLFNEQVEIRDGRMIVPDRIGSGFTFNRDSLERYTQQADTYMS